MLFVSNISVFANSSANPNKDGSQYKAELAPSIEKVVYVGFPEKCLIGTYDLGWSGNTELALSHDGKFLASVNNSDCGDLDDGADYNGDREVCKIKLLNALNGELISSFSDLNVTAHSLAFSSVGENIVSVHDDGYIHIWNVLTGKLSQSIKVNWDGISAVTFRSKDDMIFLTGSDRGYLKLWTLKEQADSNYFVVEENDFTSIVSQFTDKKYSFSSVAMSSDGKKIVYRFSNGRFEKRILLIDIDKRDILWSKNIATDGSHGDSLAFSPDDKKVVYAHNYGLILLDATTGDEEKSFEHADDSGSVTTVTFSPDGKTIVSGDASGRITLWDVETGNIRVMVANDFRERKRSVQSLVLSPDGKIMTSASQGNINQWDFTCVNNNPGMACYNDYDGHCVIVKSMNEILNASENKEERFLSLVAYFKNGSLLFDSMSVYYANLLLQNTESHGFEKLKQKVNDYLVYSLAGLFSRFGNIMIISCQRDNKGRYNLKAHAVPEKSGDSHAVIRFQFVAGDNNLSRFEIDGVSHFRALMSELISLKKTKGVDEIILSFDKAISKLKQ